MAAPRKYDLVLLDDDRDAILVTSGACRTCLYEKLPVLRIWTEIPDSDLRELVLQKTPRVGRIRCECGRPGAVSDQND